MVHPTIRIALLSPYTGGNLGDATIQDAAIANLRGRLRDVEFSGISLNSQNFLERHGSNAFPLSASDYVARAPVQQEIARETANPRRSLPHLKKFLRAVPGLRSTSLTLKNAAKHLSREFRHGLAGYKFIRDHDLLLVCGGGQLDEEWGGPWGHPFALAKWAILSKVARVPYVIASVGAGKTRFRLSRVFLSIALRAADYRSYRDTNSRAIVSKFFHDALNDVVVPDLAFSIPATEIPPPADIRTLAGGRTIVAISPMAYAKPGVWPSPDANLYHQYLEQLAEVVSQLLRNNYFVVFVWSARSDESVIPELLSRLDKNSQTRLAGQSHFLKPVVWKDLLAALQSVDLLIASRLHSAILGFIALNPLVAISFDPKVDWVMKDLGQSDSVLAIRDFTGQQVIESLARLERRKQEVVQRLAAYRQQALEYSSPQYDAIARMALGRANRRAQTAYSN